MHDDELWAFVRKRRKLRLFSLEFETIDAVRLPGLTERRHPVLIGGLAVLFACFEALQLDIMKVSPYALREGVLHDLLGRLDHEDPRDTIVAAFILGLTETAVASLIDPGLTLAAAYLLFILVLLFRPQGLFGDKIIERV